MSEASSSACPELHDASRERADLERQVKQLTATLGHFRHEVYDKRVSIARIAAGVMLGMFLHTLLCAMIGYAAVISLGLVLTAGGSAAAQAAKKDLTPYGSSAANPSTNPAPSQGGK